MKAWALVAYRLAAVACLAWFVRAPQPETIPAAPGALRTSPTCDHVVGYSGPNDVAISLDAAGRIARVQLLRSGDTTEHVAAVRTDPAFFAQFVGLDPADPQALTGLDGVSRATLTSLAILEAVILRLSGSRPSLRFPVAVTLAEVQALLPTAEALDGETVLAAGTPIGRALRTGPRTEAVVGYQGPTDTLLVFDPQGILRGMRLRQSYENEKYIGYVRDEPYFAEQFVGRSLTDLARLPEVDGVSGATMSSDAIAASVCATAEQLLATPPRPAARRWLSLRDTGTLIAVGIALLLTFSRLRRSRALRLATRVGIIAYLGILSGDMLSQGLLIGWTQHGLPSAAPGLVVLAGVALLVPAASGRQPYCHQLCAHGALQELLRRAPWQRPMPRQLVRWLRPLPALTLGAVAAAAALGLRAPFGSLEPFGAWAWPLAGIATIVLFGLSVLVASFYSMAYCRLGCPTGALLDFVRHRGVRDRFRLTDGIAGGLALLAPAVTTFS